MNLLRVHLQLIGMAVLWGASWPWGRVVAQSMPPLSASAVRFFLAFVSLLIWLYWANGFIYIKKLLPRQWFGLFLTALLGIFAYSIFFLLGLKYVPAGKGGIIVATNPVFTTIFAIFLFKEKWNRWVILGMLIAVSGSLTAMTKGQAWLLFQALGIGEWLLIGALVCWVAYTLLARKVLSGIDSLSATTISAGFGCLMLWMAALSVESTNDWLHLLQAPALSWFALLGLAFGSTVLAYVWYFDGVKYLGAGNASAYIILVPICGVLFSACWLGESIEVSLLTGGTMAVSGLAMMHWGRRVMK